MIQIVNRKVLIDSIVVIITWRKWNKQEWITIRNQKSKEKEGEGEGEGEGEEKIVTWYWEGGEIERNVKSNKSLHHDRRKRKQREEKTEIRLNWTLNFSKFSLSLLVLILLWVCHPEHTNEFRFLIRMLQKVICFFLQYCNFFMWTIPTNASLSLSCIKPWIHTHEPLTASFCFCITTNIDQ